MSTHRNIDRICIGIIIAALLFTVLFMNGSRLGITAIVDEDAETYTGSENFTSKDMDGSWDTEGATFIELSGDTAEIEGNGAYTYDGSVYITGAGRYVFTGRLNDGSIVVDAYESSKVYIMLDGVEISCTDSAALLVNQAEKVFLTLADGSDNRLLCGDTYSDEAVSDKVTGAIHTHDDLTINGSGSLEIEAGYMHGIVSKDDLVITGGEVSITAKEDGLHVNDAVKITDADISISSGDDGIHSDGSFLIEGGKLTISECYEGIEAVTIEVAGGDTLIYSEDDGLNANGGSGDMFGMGGRPMSMPSGVSGPDMENTVNKPEIETESEENDEEETYIHISGGTLTIINGSGRDADGIDSNGDLIITGGDVRVSLTDNGNNSALDYASEAGGTAKISGGSVVAAGNSSMAERFDESSDQISILYNMEDPADAGTTVTLSDSSGKVLLTYEVPQSFSSVNISCPELAVGETYRLAIGDDEEEITPEDTAASYGNVSAGGFGGMNPGGGMPPEGARGGISGNSVPGAHGGRGMHGMGQRPGSGDRPETADMSGQSRAGGEGMNAGPGGMSADEKEDEEAESPAIKGTSLDEYDSDTWLALIISAAGIIAATGFAFIYHRRRRI